MLRDDFTGFSGIRVAGGLDFGEYTAAALTTLVSQHFGPNDMAFGFRWLRVPLAGGTGSEVDTGLDLPTKGFVLPWMWLDVVVAEATGSTKTLDVGLLSSESGGDADGFIDGLSVAATGVKFPAFVATVGSNNTYLGAAATHTMGALLTGILIAGEDTAAGGDGFAWTRPHVLNGTAKSLSIKTGSAFTEFSGVLWLPYVELP